MSSSRVMSAIEVMPTALSCASTPRAPISFCSRVAGGMSFSIASPALP